MGGDLSGLPEPFFIGLVERIRPCEITKTRDRYPNLPAVPGTGCDGDTIGQSFWRTCVCNWWECDEKVGQLNHLASTERLTPSNG